ncbi:MAG: APC family permease [Myxococcota bacterium]|nr:APC family permease [Myxococcota bacterium]MEC9391638.1 APC family permease [Myxococcota bacterium]
MTQSPTLRRSLGLATVVSLGINGVIGQGIFLLPGKAAGMMGPSAGVALLLGGVLCFLIALCFAEVSARFDGTGGAYLYTREAFGDFVGFEVGWMTLCVGIISWAALSNGFTLVLGHFIPAVAEGWVQKAVALSVITLLTLVNWRGASSGASVVKFFTVAKMIPLLVFVLVGLFFVDGARFTPFAPQGTAPLAETTMLLLYAYAGFETLVVPAGEMANPQRNVPKALFIVMAIVTTVYMGVFGVAVATFDGIAGHENPVAAASAAFLGPVGGTLIAAGICLSVFGTNSGSALVNPRRFFAMAERGDLPAFLARVDPETGAPRAAIATTWALACALSLSGTFAELAVLGVLARFAQYIPTCIAVLVFRRRDETPHDGFRIPGGPVIPLLTVALCVLLLANTDPTRLLKGGIALVVGVPLYFLARRNRARAAAG